MRGGVLRPSLTSMIVCGWIGLAGCEGGLVATASDLVTLNGGQFQMGSAQDCADAAGVSCKGDRAPHLVKVSSFIMQVTEVSQIQYATCVINNQCPDQGAFDPKKKDLPMLVDSPDAGRAYCRSLGMRLPTEAEFEYAARVDSHGEEHVYPWGRDQASDKAPGCDQVSFMGCRGDTYSPVGSTPADVTDTGIRDLAGSVPEWVDDTYEPYAGCLDRLSYGDLCFEQSMSCLDAQARCTADGKLCARGCLPLGLSEHSTGPQETLTPVCRIPSASDTALVDPLVRAADAVAVVRGGGALDGACAFVGFTRRYAVPGRYRAGFRCVQSAGGTVEPPALTSYRFSLTHCQPDAPVVKLSVGTSQNPNASFTVDVFPSSGEPMMTATSQNGVVDNLPCSAVFVVHPVDRAPLVVDVRSTSAQGCRRGTAAPDLTGGGDAPGKGVLELALTGSCM